ncbi:hybrid PKS-NRPS protein [Xylaria longipes]|nr:hybrid PKS-NRPS protein [Xylaria longipes]
MSSGEPIAVVGRACRAPGDSTSPSKLWELLKNPRDVLGDRIPSTRFDPNGFYHPDGADHHGSIKVQRSYLLGEDHRLFDASFFNIHPREAEAIDPQQRLLLETVYESLEDGGFPMESLRGSSVGVYVGVMTADFNDVQVRDPASMPQYIATGSSRAIVSNRISYFFDWRGPSMTIDTACSSSLVAVHLAVQSLRSGEITSAVAAGSNLILGPEMYIAESKLNMLSAQGYSRMWDTNVDGYARGEGTAAIVLKTLSQAVRDGDHIHCIIRETGLNQDGRTTGITMPGVVSQSTLIRDVYSRAGLDLTNPRERCQYFEAHGTGTAAGDSIEAEAIHRAFFGEPEDKAAGGKIDDKIFVGSIKTIIGHLEGAAGLAGLLKASLAVQHGIIPPNLHFKKLNPKIKPFYGKLEIPIQATPWPALEEGNVRRVSVNSFGFGGANAHAIVEQYIPRTQNIIQRDRLCHTSETLSTPLVFSASSELSLAANIEAFADMLDGKDASIGNAEDLEHIAATLQSRRSNLPIKFAVTGTTRPRLAAKLRTLLKASPVSKLGVRSKVAQGGGGASSKILGVFTGQGAQWASMGADLLGASPTFLRSIKALEESLADLPSPPTWSLCEELAKPTTTSRISEAALSQPLCTALQVGLLDILSEAGITFDFVVGHSSGEIAAAYAAGFITARDAIRIAYLRGESAKFSGRSSDDGQKIQGGMLAVGLSYEEAITLCSQPQYRGRVQVAASNSPSSSTLSGDLEMIEDIAASLSAKGTFARLLKVDVAYHSHHMIPCAVPYQSMMTAAGVTAQQAPESCATTWISSVTGEEQTFSNPNAFQALHDGSYWVRNMTDSVLFADAVRRATLQSRSFDFGLEVGPHPALKGPVIDTIKESGAAAVLPYQGLLKRRGREQDPDSDVESLGNAVGFAWMNDSRRVNWAGYRSAMGVSALVTPVPDLPTYKWEHVQPFWAESRLSRNFRTRADPPHSLLGSPCAEADSAEEKRWRNFLKLEELPWLKGHKFQSVVLLPASFYVALATEAICKLVDASKTALIEIGDVVLPRAVTLEEGSTGVEMIASLQKDRDDEHYYHFSAYACKRQDQGTLERTATASIRVIPGVPNADILPAAPLVRRGDMVEMDVDRLYQSIADMGLEYSGDFQGIEEVHKRHHYCQAEVWKPSVGRGDAKIDPAFLDVCFHSVFAALCFPYDDTLWGPFLPTSIHRLKINLYAIGLDCPLGVPYSLDCQVTDSSAQSFSADIHIRQHTDGPTMIQIEQFTCSSIARPSPENDRKLFQKTVWQPDIVHDAVSGQYTPEFKSWYQPSSRELVHLRERIGYFYLRKLHESNVDRSSIQWHYRYLVEWADRVVAATRSGNHSVRKPDWDKDTADYLEILERAYPGHIEIQLLHMIGKNLDKIVVGETAALQLAMSDDILGRAYQDGFNFAQLNQHLAGLVSRLSHRYPSMKILEIGAGTGSATSFILNAVNGAYEHYTFTDISQGFFVSARTKFASELSRMSFSLLDIEKGIEEQGFAPGSFDLIIASNVLHATRTMKNTLANVRKLLRPGGFLALLEVTSEYLAPRVIVSPFEGWWLGAESDGRIDGPCLSRDGWDELLHETGFSGVDISLMDEPDEEIHVASVMLSQAVDDTVAFLREPQLHPSPAATITKLVVLAAPGRQNLAKQLISQMGLEAQLEVEVCGLDEIEKETIPWGSAVLSVVELQGPPVLVERSVAKLQQLQHVFAQAHRVLWVTRGAIASRPHCHGTVGLIRTLKSEEPHLRFHILDIEDDKEAGEVYDGFSHGPLIAQAMLRLIWDPSTITTYGASQDYHFDATSALWTSEPESRIVGGRLFIPRIKQDEGLNDRLNASRRAITHRIKASSGNCAQLVERDEIISLKEAKTADSRVEAAGAVLVEVSHSLLFPVAADQQSGRPLYLCLGHDQTRHQVVALSPTNASSVWSSVMFRLTDQVERGKEAYFLHYVAAALIADGLRDSNTLIHNAEPLLLSHIQRVKGITCSSSRVEDCKSSGVIWIHPQITKSNLSAVVRRIKPTTLVDLSDGPSPLQQLSGVDVRRSPMTSVKDSSDIETVLSHAAGTAASRLAYDNSPVIIDASEGVRLDSNSTEDQKPWYTAVDWTSRTYKVQIDPLDYHSLFSSNKTYLLVGLTRELGLSLAQWMLTHGVRHLVLTSRNPNIDPVWIGDMKTNFNARIEVLPMDICDENSVRATIENITSKESGLPPLGGAVNGAMVLSDHLFSDMTFEDMEIALKPKVEGSELLCTHLPRELDFFVMLSSISGVIGKFGQANYNAANMFMASLARQRRAQGLVASVLDIGMVLGVGLVARNGTKYETPLRAVNCLPIAEQEVHAIFAEAVVASRLPLDAQGRPLQELMNDGEIITGIKDCVVGRDNPPWMNNPRFAHLITGKGLGAEKAGDINEVNDDTHVGLEQQLDGALNQAEATGLVETEFVSKIANLLQMPSDKVYSNVPLIDIGVDSLLAVEIRTWILHEVGIDLPILKVLSGANITELSATIAREYVQRAVVLQDSSRDSGKGSSEADDLIANDDTTTPQTPFTTMASSDYFGDEKLSDAGQTSVSETLPRVGKTSFSQSRLWFMHQYLEDKTTCNISLSYNVEGIIDLARLETALEKLVHLHPSLRTSFQSAAGTAEPLQTVLATGNISLTHQQFSDATDPNIEMAINSARYHVFDIRNGETMRVQLLSWSATSHILVFCYHHLIMDGVSWRVFLHDLNLAYNDSPFIPRPFGDTIDFADEQHHQIESGVLADDLSFWKEQFTQLPVPLPLLPFSRTPTRKPLQAYDQVTVQTTLPAHLMTKIRAVSRASSVTPFHFHLATLQILLSKLGEIDDVCIGIADANRVDARFADKIGFFLNLLPTRFQVDSNATVKSLFQKTRTTVFSALEHSRLPFDLILKAVNVPSATTHSPLFQAIMNYRLGADEQSQLGDCNITGRGWSNARTPYDLDVDILDRSSGDALLTITTQEYLYPVEEADRLSKAYIHLLQALTTTNPEEPISRLTLYSPIDGQRDLNKGRGLEKLFQEEDNNTEKEATLSADIDKIIRLYPYDIAINDDMGSKLTYEQMGRQRDAIQHRISHYLDQRSFTGTSPPAIAVAIQPGPEFVCSLLAIIRAGGLYVPLDLRNPPKRLALILQSCDPTAILCHPSTIQLATDLVTRLGPQSQCSLIDVSSIENSDEAAPPDDLSTAGINAFALYTSGSTGVPKGVVLRDRNLRNHIKATSHHYGLGREVFLQQSSPGFDMSILQIFLPLSQGGTVVTVSQNSRGDPIALSRIMKVTGVTMTIATPSEYTTMLRYGGQDIKDCATSQTWKFALCGGEVLNNALCAEFDRLASPALKLINVYGPTEVSVACSEAVINYQAGKSDIEFRPVGATMPNYSVYILDRGGRPVPTGYPGEIFVGGAGVTSGYLGDPKQTQERFVRDPFATPQHVARGWDTMYQTRDRGRLLEDGSLIFLGRMEGDTQIKLRGLRIELEEVAQALLHHAAGALAEVAVCLRGEGGSDGYLVAFATCAANNTDVGAQSSLFDSLLATLPLPVYMRPATIVPLERFPLTPNGKIDRRELAKMSVPRKSAPAHSADPSSGSSSSTLSDAEARMKTCWEEVLPLEMLRAQPGLSADSDFFRVGGNSLLLVELQAHIQKQWGADLVVSLPHLFQASTLGTMAMLVEYQSTKGPQEQPRPVLAALDWGTETSIASWTEELPCPTNGVGQQPKTEGLVVLLTGATGFLGRTLLKQLCDHPNIASVVCVAIRPDVKNAGEPIEHRIAVQSPKIRAYAGDLGATRLGLSEDDFARLADTVDAIVHNGATVSFLQTYQSLRGPNVSSTGELVRMALPRRIPLHYLSTAGIARLVPGADAITEKTSLAAFPPPADGSDGYVASKWASEQMLRKVSRAHRLPVRVHRPVSIVGDGAASTDLMVNLMAYARQLRVAPRLDSWTGFFDLVQVDDVAAEIVDTVFDNAGASSAPLYAVVHESGGVYVPVREMAGFVSRELEGGAPVAEVPLGEWIGLAETAGMPYTVASYLRSVSDVPVRVPRLLKERRRGGN